MVMLRLLGGGLILFSCTALGWNRSRELERRVWQLHEIEKMVYLILGEIQYRKEALPDALLRISGKLADPLGEFLRAVAKQAKLFYGECFSHIFRKQAKVHFAENSLTAKELEEFLQLGEYLGWLDVDMQRKNLELYLRQLGGEIQVLEKELPAKRKMYQSLGLLSGLFLIILLL